jgi:hypothetical protein
MFRRSRIRIDKTLLARVWRHANRAGYSSAEEFIAHLLERELAHFEDAASDEDVRKRLKGLGYIS